MREDVSIWDGRAMDGIAFMRGSELAKAVAFMENGWTINEVRSDSLAMALGMIRIAKRAEVHVIQIHIVIGMVAFVEHGGIIPRRTAFVRRGIRSDVRSDVIAVELVPRRVVIAPVARCGCVHDIYWTRGLCLSALCRRLCSPAGVR